MAHQHGHHRFIIGYGLLQKKQRSFVQPSLVDMAKSHGVDLIPIDLQLPLADQGPFHAIIHKLSGFHGWNQQLADYSASHPDVLIIDAPNAIARLNNRITMLQAVSELQINGKACLNHGEISQKELAVISELEITSKASQDSKCSEVIASGNGKVSDAIDPLSVNVSDAIAPLSGKDFVKEEAGDPQSNNAPAGKDDIDSQNNEVAVNGDAMVYRNGKVPLNEGTMASQYIKASQNCEVSQNEDNNYGHRNDGKDKDSNQDEEEAFLSVPKQCLLLGDDIHAKDEADGITQKVAITAGLSFPVIAKPLVVDGSTDSHSMLLAFNPEGLSKLKPPMVIQEFINHGGVIFKVYVVGDHVRCVRRASLPDIDLTDNESDNSREPLPFCQISNTNTLNAYNTLTRDLLQEVGLPPAKFLSHIASGLRKALGLRLFNFDIIRDAKCKSHYYIIDINYFPGYAKMPDYEIALTNFFVSLAEEHASS